MAHTDAYRKDTGEKVRIPEHFLDHPVLGEPFQKTRPRTPAAEDADEASDTTPAESSAPTPGDAATAPSKTRAARGQKGQ